MSWFVSKLNESVKDPDRFLINCFYFLFLSLNLKLDNFSHHRTNQHLYHLMYKYKLLHLFISLKIQDIENRILLNKSRFWLSHILSTSCPKFQAVMWRPFLCQTSPKCLKIPLYYDHSVRSETLQISFKSSQHEKGHICMREVTNWTERCSSSSVCTWYLNFQSKIINLRGFEIWDHKYNASIPDFNITFQKTRNILKTIYT